jgi:hypothetical protein
MSLLRKSWRTLTGAPVEPEAPRRQLDLNPFTEAQPLRGHRDMVHVLVALGPDRIASGDDEGVLQTAPPWPLPSS